MARHTNKYIGVFLKWMLMVNQKGNPCIIVFKIFLKGDKFSISVLNHKGYQCFPVAIILRKQKTTCKIKNEIQIFAYQVINTNACKYIHTY